MRLLILAILLIPSAAGALNIPLTASEALPSNYSGRARTAEVATGGIPLPENSGVTSTSQLGLTGAAAGQFRILGRWPNGNAKWVLVDFPATVTGGGSVSATLTDGGGNFGGSDLATDNGTAISVDTGAGVFSVKKSNFNLFDSVVVGGATVAGGGRFHVIGTDDVDYSSDNDSSSTAVIEENGPVRTVVKAVGSFKSSGGVRLFDYTVRLHFYKGSTRVKGALEIRNASTTGANLSKTFKSIEAVVNTSLGSTKTVTMGKNATPATTGLTSTAFLFQGFTQGARAVTSSNFIGQGYYWQPPLPGDGTDPNNYVYDTNYSGVNISVDGSVLSAFGTATDRADSVASMQDATGKGVSLVYRSLADFWPGGFEFKNSGYASVELYSKQNPYNAAKPIKLAFGQHDTREVMWDFHTGTTDNQTAYYHLSFPLTVRASFTHYVSTKALYGQSEFVSTSDQSSFVTALSKATAGAATNLAAAAPVNPPDTYVFRGWSWSSGGGWNQNNHLGDDLLDYLRTGGGGFLLKGEARARMHNDSAFSRSDDYSTEILPASQTLERTALTSGAPDGEHTYLYGHPLYYYLTGNEAAKEGWLDYGDRLLRNNMAPYYYNLPYSQWLRGISNTMRNTAIVYEFSCETGTCSVPLKSALEGAIAYQLDSRDTGAYGVGQQGRNLDRGYLYWDVDVTFGGTQKRVVHSLYHNHIHFESLYQVWRVMNRPEWNYSRLTELEDYMTGLAKFYLEEWFEAPPANDALALAPFNFPYAQHYDLKLDEATPYNAYPSAGFATPYSVSRAAIWAYQRTGIAKYLDIGANMVWEQPAYSTDSKRNPSELQDQAMMYYYLNQNALTAWQPLTVTASELGGGSYLLSWTVPSGAKQIRVKHATRQVVEWLGFNATTRAYQYSPTSYAPYFSATNTLQTAATGGIQTATVTGLPTGLTSANFAARYSTEAAITPTHRSLIGRFVGRIR